MNSTPSTGYMWVIKSMGSGLEKKSSDFIPPSTQMPGAGGKQVFVLDAKSVGTQVVDLAYRRSWEKEDAYQAKVEIDVTAP
mmetsp:Transcript_1866/g.5641  ORF Transcript_1866/g.5641 Transcript_1866/m.5641 type:complete len:81 (+) Transcript_1866:314-556(+)